jgi:hypothetical protein
MIEEAIRHATLNTLVKITMFPIDVAFLRFLIWIGICELCALPRPSLRQTVGLVALVLTLVNS